MEQEQTRDNIALSAARTRLSTAFFAELPNAHSYSDSQQFTRMLDQLGYRQSDGTVDNILGEPELADLPRSRVIRTLQLLAQEKNRSGGSYTKHGVSRGFTHGLSVSPEVVDAIIALGRRKLAEGGITLAFDEIVPDESRNLPKTVRVFLDRRGDELMDVLVKTLGLPAAPVPNEEFFGMMMDGLVEAGAASRFGNATNNVSTILSDKVAASFAGHGDGVKEKQAAMRRMVKAMTYARGNVSAGMDAELAAIGPREVRMFAEIIRDNAPQFAAGFQDRIQVGETSWQANPTMALDGEGPRIELTATGASPLRTRIPYSRENVDSLFGIIGDETGEMKAMGETISPRVGLAKIQRAVAEVEKTIIGK